MEEGVQACNSAVTETRFDIKYMREQMSGAITELCKKVDLVLTGVEDIKPRLAKVEEEHRVKATRRAWARNAVIGLVLTGAGAAIASVAEKLVGK